MFHQRYSVDKRAIACWRNMKKSYKLPSIYSGIFLLPVLFLIVFTVTNCEKYFGYNYDAESLIESVSISGTVTNSFTSQPVSSASVKIGVYETFTDKNGDYLLIYPLGSDEERDKPIPVLVSATNYFPDSLNIIIYPQPLELKFSLVYGAPIIESAALVPSDPPTATATAVVFDYQGVNDIDSVAAIFTYFDSLNVKTEKVVPMFRTRILSDNQAEYQCNTEIFSDSFGNLNFKHFQIVATDKAGFSDKEDFFQLP